MIESYVIRNRDEDILYQGSFSSLKQCVERAVEEGVSLKRANLEGANLINATLDGADLEEANLSRAQLTGANMSECNLRSTLCLSASFVDVCLCESDLSGANMMEASFDHADISGSLFENAIFSCPTFFHLNLSSLQVFKDNIFYTLGQYLKMKTIPLVLLGWPRKLVMMDDAVLYGANIYYYQPHEKERCDELAEVSPHEGYKGLDLLYADVLSDMRGTTPEGLKFIHSFFEALQNTKTAFVHNGGHADECFSSCVFDAATPNIPM